ncbi:MAG: BTAD domain-containing putative transcriptional regulator, partial [Streptosporangiaceae bacterium]
MKLRAILAVLLARAGQVVPAGVLAELVWDGVPPEGAASTLRSHVMRLRRVLGPRAGARLVTRYPGYLIQAGSAEVDLLRFSALGRNCGVAACAGAWEQVAGLAGQALGLWRGEPLADIASPALVRMEVPHLERLRLQLLEWDAEAGLQLGRHRELVPGLQELVSVHRLHERFYALLMLALYRSGRQADALMAYLAARHVLAEELGADPGPALQALHQQMLTGDPALSPPGPGPALGVHAAPGTVVDLRFSLPPDSAAFTGRQAELDRITASVLEGACAGGVVAIHTIGGMPGVGKTALAVHAAHLLREEFPDRCLFIDLHAHTPGHSPLPPETALANLLAAAGVPARYLPGDLEGRAALWRDKMAGQRALLVLDNAASSQQVRPLLPGGDGCLVLVTSRRHLADLPGAAASLLLPTLAPPEARDMFARLAPRAAASPQEAVAELAGLTGHLPLAICLLARLFTRHPAWTLADLATETRQSLLSLTAENDSIAAAFGLSYRHLDPAQQRFFALLGLHPGTTIDPYAATALTGTTLTNATSTLDELHGEGLLTETSHRRYGMHDLLRRYAHDRATTLPAQTSERALGRLLDYYQHTATLAQNLLARRTRPGRPPATPAPPTAPALQNAAQALAWARAERDNLLACLDHISCEHQHTRTITLTAALAEPLRRDGPWAEAIARHTTALDSARHLSDRPSQANTLNELGAVRRMTGDSQGAAADLESALSIYRDLSDRHGQGDTLNELGIVRRMTGDYPGAAADLDQALVIYRDLGDRRGQASALSGLGIVRRMMTGDYPGAVGVLEQALAIYRDLDDRLGQASTLSELGAVRQMTGDYQSAAADLDQALVIYRDLGDRRGQANTLTYLGTGRRLTGDYQG